MSCQICLMQYDHSRHKPYSLSCPHTVCLHCLNKLNDPRCPICKASIQAKHPNLALLELIPQSEYDCIRMQLEKKFIEAKEIKQMLSVECEKFLVHNLNELKTLKRQVTTQANELIDLIRKNKSELLNQVNCIEFSLTKQMNSFELDSQIGQRMKNAELCELSINELDTLNEDILSLKKKLNRMKSSDFLKQTHKFVSFTNVNSETGVFGEIISSETEFEKFMKLGKEMFEMKLYEKSVSYFDKAIEVNSSRATAYNFKGVSLSAMKSYKQAIDCYDKSIELDPTDSILYCNKGMVLANLKEYKQALECLNKAIEINSNYYIAYKERGIVLMNMSLVEESLLSFNKSIEINSSDPTVWNFKGILFFKEKQYKQAIECYKQAIQLDPANYAYHFNKGIALKEFNQYNESIACLNRAIEVNLKLKKPL